MPVAPIQTLPQVMSHPQVQANSMLVHAINAAGERGPLVGTPFKVEGAGPTPPAAAPKLGEHTDAILAELGFSRAEVSAFRAAKAVWISMGQQGEQP